MSAASSLALESIDPNRLRADHAAMRSTLNDVAKRGAETWTGPWPELVSALSDVARVDLCLGRLVEGHADAVRIFDQAGVQPQPGCYGVWASRSAGTGLLASPTGSDWVLDGELRFASGIDLIDRALVPGWIDPEHHLLFDVQVDGFIADRESWHSAAMDASRSFTCRCTELPAGQPVGGQDFYLSRPGFAAGGLGPAAVWRGGAFLVVDLVAEGLARFSPSAHQRRRLGVMEQACWSADAAIARAAAALDAGHEDFASQVSHARTAVVATCDAILLEAPLVVGPGGLSSNERLARAIADLSMYVRQHHIDGSMESYGTTRLASEANTSKG